MSLLMVNAHAANWIVFDADQHIGTNYYDKETLEYQGSDRKVTVLNNGGENEKGAKSTVSTAMIDCRLGTFQVLGWQTFSEPMGVGSKLESSSKPTKVFFIMPGSLEFELKKKICS